MACRLNVTGWNNYLYLSLHNPLAKKRQQSDPFYLLEYGAITSLTSWMNHRNSLGASMNIPVSRSSPI